MLRATLAVLFFCPTALGGPGDEGLYAWFDGLGYPDLGKCPFVRVATGHYYKLGDDPPVNTYHFGFLLQADGPRFTVFTTALARETYTKSAPGVPEHQRVEYEKWGLDKHAAELLQTLRQPEDPDAWPRRFGERLSEAAEIFVLARACAAQGHAQRGAELITQAKQQAQKRRQGPAEDFPQALAGDIAHAEMWRAVEAFGDPQVPRKALLASFTRVVKHFPRSEHAARAQETAALLEKMVAEDEAHARRPRKPEQALTKEERIAELIFRLRDQNGHQLSQPGSCDIFAVYDPLDGGKLQSAAHQLVEIGYDAVPQLQGEQRGRARLHGGGDALDSP